MKKPTKKQETKGLLKDPKKIKRIVWRIGLVALIIFGIWSCLWTRPIVAYPYYFVKCGFILPVVGGFESYHLPGQKRYTFYGFRYFCTEQEAREAGYSKYILGE